jgi:hypothetical protein
MERSTKEVSPELARLVLVLPLAQANTITDAYWVSRESFDAALPGAAGTFDGTALIAADGRLLVELYCQAASGALSGRFVSETTHLRWVHRSLRMGACGEGGDQVTSV